MRNILCVTVFTYCFHRETVYLAYDEIKERVATVVKVEEKFVRAVGDYQEVSN